MVRVRKVPRPSWFGQRTVLSQARLFSKQTKTAPSEESEREDGLWEPTNSPAVNS